MTARGTNPDHPWVQPIIVAKSGSHTATIRCAALASARVYFEPHERSPLPYENYAHWLSGPFTKTVRRASMQQMAGLRDWAHENGIPYGDATTGDSAAVAFPPLRYAEMPKRLAKHQVHGTDFPREPTGAEHEPGVGPGVGADDEAGARVWLLVDESLTTGKAAAAAGHALWAWMLPRLDDLTTAGPAEPTDGTATAGESTAGMTAWRRKGHPVGLRLVTATRLAEAAHQPGAHPVVDSGLTEVTPNTLTAVAFSHPGRPTGLTHRT